MASKPTPKVSYCTTCKGRLHHLMQTLPANLAAERGNPNVEFVVLDYGSEDGVGEWIKANFMPEIQSGRLVYARTEQADFRMAHAKNMAHRLGSGDVLCNVDADNFIVPNFSRWLSKQFTKHPNAFVSSIQVDPLPRLVGRLDRKYLGRHSFTKHPGDATGRLAVSKKGFEEIGGYDESYSAWGDDDMNILGRARTAGMKIVVLRKKFYGDAIAHADEDRWQNMSLQDQERSKLRLEQRAQPSSFANLLEEYHSAPQLVPARNNPDQTGCGQVTLNFGDSFTIEPLQARKPAPMIGLEPDQRRTDWGTIVRSPSAELQIPINPAAARG